MQLDTKANSIYNSCSNKVTVLLGGKTAAVPLTDATLATEVVPAHRVVDVLQLADRRCVDLLAMVHDIEDHGILNTSKGRRQKFSVHLLDKGSDESEACSV